MTSRRAGSASGKAKGARRVQPEEAMRLALRQARRGQGRVWPNPSVGAVIFRGSEILGKGCTQPPPGAHAEIVALRQALRRHGERALRGASIAVTLEPCSHQGRTPPCADALIEAGIARVYAGCRDPHPQVAGKGYRKLRRAGVKVETGVLGDASRESHRGFLSVVERERPFVVLKLASTLDGRIATASGESRWITGPSARRFVHDLRARTDGVMVGAGTALADDPQLTARRASRVTQRPVRVLLDSRLRVPLRSALFCGLDASHDSHPSNESQTWVLCRRGARGVGARAAAGARIFELPVRPGRAVRGARAVQTASNGHLDLGQALRTLARAGLGNLLVEGGGELAAALLRAKLVDEIHWMLAPKLIGSDGRAALGPLGLDRLVEASSLRDVRSARLGEDLHISARLGDFR